MGRLEEILAKNVKNRRKSLGLSQKKLASLAGVSEHTVLRLEKQSQETKRDNIVAIAQVLKCTPEDLYIDSSKTPKTNVEWARLIDQLSKELDHTKSALRAFESLPPTASEVILNYSGGAESTMGLLVGAAYEKATPDLKRVIRQLLRLEKNPAANEEDDIADKRMPQTKAKS